MQNPVMTSFAPTRHGLTALQYYVSGVLAVLGLAFFVDLSVPLGIASWVVYLLPIGLALRPSFRWPLVCR